MDEIIDDLEDFTFDDDEPVTPLLTPLLTQSHKGPLVLFIGDPHFRTDNIVEVDMFIERITELARERQPDFIVIGGDVLHTHERLHTTPLNRAYAFINAMREITKTFVLVGNHDALNNSIFLEPKHWMNAMKEWDNTVIVDFPVYHEYKGCVFGFMPYVPPGRFIEGLNRGDRDWHTADCIFAHQEFAKCKMGVIESAEGDIWDDSFPHVVSGHIHERQHVGRRIYYPGSSLQHAFNESDTKIVAMLHFSPGGTYRSEEICLGLPQKHTVYSNSDQVVDMEVDRLLEGGKYVKLVVSGSSEEFRSFKKTKKYKDLCAAGVKVAFKGVKINKVPKPSDSKKPAEFMSVLQDLVHEEGDSYLTKIFHDMIKQVG